MRQRRLHSLLCLASAVVCGFLPSTASGKVLGAKEVSQEQTQWCWAAVSRSVLDYYGHDIAQCTIAEYTRSVATWHDYGSTSCCADPSQGCDYWNWLANNAGSIQDILQQLGNLPGVQSGSLQQTEVETEINTHSRPFIVRWVWSYGGGHFVVGHGIVGDLMHYMDPWPGEGLKTGQYSWVLSGGNHTWANTLKLTTTCACTATGTCCDGCKAANENGACNDNDACTLTDACQAGKCIGASPKVCTPLDQCHLAGTCDPQTGACSDPAKPDGTTCDDKDLCTQTDACQAGKCSGASQKICTPLDQCHLAGTCDPQTGACSDPAKPDGTTCDDGNLCTLTDSCQSGACVGAPKACTPLDQCHLPGACDPATGTCSNPVRPDGDPCDDNDTCTQTDTCQASVCIGADPKPCTPLDQCQLAGSCDPTTGDCSYPNRPDGTACDDGDACTSDDTCQSGSCSGAVKPCPAPDECHEEGSCDPATGDCSNPNRPDGSPCSVGLCLGGACKPKPEAGPDLVPPADLGVDAGDEEVPDNGCECRVTRQDRIGPAPMLALTLALLVLWWRPRRFR